MCMKYVCNNIGTLIASILMTIPMLVIFIKSVMLYTARWLEVAAKEHLQ